MWEGGVCCTNHKSQLFLHLHRVANFSVGSVKLTWLWASLGYYALPGWFTKPHYR